MNDQIIYFEPPSSIQNLLLSVGDVPYQVTTQYITSPSGVINNLTSQNVYITNITGPLNGLPTIRGATGPQGATGPSLVIMNTGAKRILTDVNETTINAEEQLMFDNINTTLTLGPNTSPIVPDVGLNNFIVSGEETDAEVNTVCFDTTASRQASYVQHFSRGNIATPVSVQQDDICGQYFVRGMATGPSNNPEFMDIAFMNVNADYSGAAANCVGGRLSFRTRGDTSNTSPASYGYPRMDITNTGLIRFYDTLGNVAYNFPQVKPSTGQILMATGTNGNLIWSQVIGQQGATGATGPQGIQGLSSGKNYYLNYNTT